MDNKINKINWGFVFAIILWCTITLIRVFHHSPWYDEAHAWTIAQDLNLIEIFKFMRTEGHTFIWYLLLMPFAKANFMYPYSMTLLNWFFCFVAICVLWLRAPFNNWIKFAISFSFPFLALYPVVARCYSIGIMLLFILISMEKDKLKHPNWYATNLILLANTSLMGTVPATVLGIFFAYDMIKNKQKLLVPFSIAIFGAILILLQLVGSISDGLDIYINQKNDTLFKWLEGEIRHNAFFYGLCVNFIALVMSIIFWIKNKTFPKFFVFSMILLCGIFSVYAGRLWHLFFILMYFIASCWLILEKSDINLRWLVNTAILVVTVPWIFYMPISKDAAIIWNDNKGEIAKEIINDENLKDSTIMVFVQFDSSIQPYLKNSDVTLVNYCSSEVLNYNTRSYFTAEKCGHESSVDSQLIVLSKPIFDKWYRKDKLYLLTHSKIKLVNNDLVVKKLGYIFTLYKDYGRNYLWKVEKVK